MRALTRTTSTPNAWLVQTATTLQAALLPARRAILVSDLLQTARRAVLRAVLPAAALQNVPRVQTDLRQIMTAVSLFLRILAPRDSNGMTRVELVKTARQGQPQPPMTRNAILVRVPPTPTQ